MLLGYRVSWKYQDYLKAFLTDNTVRMSDENVTKRMGQLLRQGAALLNEACPKCNTPILQLKDGSRYCAKCEKSLKESTPIRVHGEQAIPGNEVLNRLATEVLRGLDILSNSLPDKPHTEELRAFAKIGRDLVEILRAIRDLQG